MLTTPLVRLPLHPPRMAVLLLADAPARVVQSATEVPLTVALHSALQVAIVAAPRLPASLTMLQRYVFVIIKVYILTHIDINQ
jgi:hypothetical protein